MGYLKGSVNHKYSKSFEQWDSLTAKFTAVSNIPFLVLQLPQIILNARNLMAGNKTALLAVPWLVRDQQSFHNLVLRDYFQSHFQLGSVEQRFSFLHFSKNDVNAGDAYWITWKPFIALVLLKKEGKRGHCSAGTGSGFHIHRI